MRRRSVTSAVGVALGLGACTLIAPFPRGVPEDTEPLCSNGLDDDFDGAADEASCVRVRPVAAPVLSWSGSPISPLTLPGAPGWIVEDVHEQRVGMPEAASGPTCAPGLVFDAELRGCEAIADCGAPRFPEPAGGVAVYVDAAGASGGDGTEDRPFRTLAEALAAVVGSEEPAILLARGEYEWVSFPSPRGAWTLLVVGVCPDQTVVSGDLTGWPFGQVELRNVQLRGGLIEADHGLVIDHSWLPAGTGSADAIAGETVTVRGSRVDRSVRAENLTVERCTIAGSLEVGATGNLTEAWIEGGLVLRERSRTTVDASVIVGPATLVEAQNDAELTLTATRLLRRDVVEDVPAIATSLATVALADVVVRGGSSTTGAYVRAGELTFDGVIADSPFLLADGLRAEGTGLRLFTPGRGMTLDGADARLDDLGVEACAEVAGAGSAIVASNGVAFRSAGTRISGCREAIRAQYVAAVALSRASVAGSVLFMESPATVFDARLAADVSPLTFYGGYDWMDVLLIDVELRSEAGADAIVGMGIRTNGVVATRIDVAAPGAECAFADLTTLQLIDAHVHGPRYAVCSHIPTDWTAETRVDLPTELERDSMP